MKRFILPIYIVITSFAWGHDFVAPQVNNGSTIAIDNRILLKLHNKAITMMDVVRKMDLLFYRQYPEMAASDAARFQFYSVSWEAVLQMVIDEELTLADAEEKKIPITDGEIRQEMETLFGPQVVLTLDKLHLTFEEAFALLKRELIVQKANSAFVRSRAMADVTPAAIERAYQNLLAGPAPENQYGYRVITVRGNEEAICLAIAQEIHNEVQKGDRSLESIVQEKNKDILYRVSLSENYLRDEGEIAITHLKILKTLALKGISAPIEVANQGEQPSYRLFLFEDFRRGIHPPLADLERKIKQELMQEAYLLHNDNYRNKLRSYYDINNEYLASFASKEFKPFAMR